MAANIPDILNTPLEGRITLTELARQEAVAPCTVHRWATKGIRGVRLPTAKVGLKRVTTQAAFLTWCEEVTTSTALPWPADRAATDTEQQVEARAARAEQELAQLGLITGDAEAND